MTDSAHLDISRRFGSVALTVLETPESGHANPESFGFFCAHFPALNSHILLPGVANVQGASLNTPAALFAVSTPGIFHWEKCPYEPRKFEEGLPMSNSRQGGRALPESIDPFIKQRLAQAETLLALKESIISSQAETISLYREAIALIKGQPVKPVRPAYRAKILPFETWSCYEPNIAPR